VSAAVCIGEPISWLRLERHALVPDAAIAEHCAACAACRQCLGQIRDDRGDLVALPPLVVPAKRARRWLAFAIPAFAAAAAIAVVMLRPRPQPQHGELLAGVKGVGDVRIELVRERAGAIALDATTYAPGDRWKVAITCAAANGAWIDVGVAEAGAHGADHPLVPTKISCGNAVAVPGAFSITGDRPNEICVGVSATDSASDGERACVTVTPEK
jgi:hypothetical protein